MPFRIARSISVCWLALFLSHAANALDSSRLISQYAHTAWRMQDGAFSGAPHVIAQTTDGYIWIGTSGGLIKFDGVRFVPWQAPEGAQLPSPTIYSLLGGSDGSLWIGTSRGLAKWKDNKLVVFENAGGRINTILEDAGHRVWVARSRVRENTGGVCEAVGKELRCFGTSGGMGLDVAGPVVRDQLGNLWIGNSNKLLRWKSDSWDSYFRKELSQYKGLSGAQALAVGADGTLWVGFDKKGLGLRKLRQGVVSIPDLPTFHAASLQVLALLEDRDDSLWIGTGDDGIYRVRGNNVEHYRSEDGLSSNSVESIYQDSEGDIWAVTSNGVDDFRDMAVGSLSMHEGLTTDQVESVLASRDGTVWVGNHEGLDILRATKVSSIRLRNGLPGHRVTSLCEDHAGLLWVGVDSSLFVYEQGQFHAIVRPDGGSIGIVVALTEDTGHNIWASVTGNDRLLFRIQDRQVREQFPTSQIPRVDVLAPDPTGGVWMGLINGDLAHYHSGKVQIIPLHQTPTTYPVTHVAADSDGSVWASTRNGLFRWKEGRLSALTSKNGLPCDGIFSSVRDDQQTLWLYARCGLMAIPDSELQRWWRQPDTLVRYGIMDAFDGAQADTSTFQPAVSKSPDGRLWFANDTSLQTVDPGHLHENRVLPPVHIEQVVADRKNYSAGDNLRLPARTRNLEIDYTALSFVVPQKVRFRYKLDGSDADWQEPGTRRQAFYTDLPPGQYRFHVIACNNDGHWNESGASLNFIVAPAYFQTFWFRLLCVGLGIAGLVAVYRFRVQQIAAVMNARFDERLAERTRLARDLHDTMLQTVQGSKMVADDALTDKADFIRMESALERLSVWLGQAIEEGRAALNALRSSTMEGNDLAEAFRRAGEECVFERPIEFNVSVEGSGQEMHPVVRDEVYRIGYEAIRNACTHSGAKLVTAELSYLDDLTLRVRDNGKGIEPDMAATGKNGHFGLVGMYERASRIRGKLTISSTAGSGTDVELVVPRSIVFERPNSVQPGRFAKIRRLFG